MKICITAQGDNLDSNVDPRFGRCQNFIIVDTDTLDFIVHQNPYIDSTGGAGIQAAQFVVDKDIKSVLSGHIGPNAFQTLQAAGVLMYVSVAGTIREVVQSFNEGKYRPTAAPDVADKFGSGK
ncbi:MAG: NifB/NifX family molybdenum-iron cluster-binding protein [Candidatus Ancaeobacter aquaticus]|nr:NifB/NifX family molybdenum-iron cluster-binding protein [Candidatus Ancaeobacter aquaticus]